MGRLIAIGDIHGQYDKLMVLLDRICPIPDDKIVFLGDYIDRGPSSKEVIDAILDLKKAFPNIICLMGNHEYLLLEYSTSDDHDLLPYLRQQGIEGTLESYGFKDSSHLKNLSFMPPEHIEFLKSLTPYYEEGEYVFVHAGLIKGKPLEVHSPRELCEVRDIFLDTKLDDGRIVVFGHTPFELPLVTSDKIGIDTGASYGNLLTAVVLPETRFYHS